MKTYDVAADELPALCPDVSGDGRGQSVDALIAAGEQVQVEAGPPVPGTYRHDFMNDWTPRHMPVSRRPTTKRP